MEKTMTTCKNNFFFYGGQPPADHETGRGCARMTKVVFTGCCCCFHKYLQARTRRSFYMIYMFYMV